MVVVSELERVGDSLQRRTWLSRGQHFFHFPSLYRRPIPLRELLELYKNDPFAKSAVEKRSFDLVGEGFEAFVENDEEKTTEMEGLVLEYNSFLRRTSLNLKWMFKRLIRDAHIFGAGIAEVIYVDDDSPIHEKPTGKDIDRLGIVNPMQVLLVEDNRRTFNDDIRGDAIPNPDYGKIVYYLVLAPQFHRGVDLYPNLTIPLTHMGVYASHGQLVHPDRILYLPLEEIGDGHVGQSLLEPAYNTLKSKIKSDKVLGTILSRYGKPVFKAILEGAAKPDRINKVSRLLAEVNDKEEEMAYIVVDEQVKELDTMGASGKALNPKPYYDIMMDNISVNFGVPRALLIGTAAGTVSGSNLNLVSYFDSLVGIQESVVEPQLLRLLNMYTNITRGHSIPEGIGIDFASKYADQIAMYKGILLNSTAAVQLYNGGLVKQNEARDMIGLEAVDGGNDFISEIIPPKEGDEPASSGDAEDDIRGAIAGDGEGVNDE